MTRLGISTTSPAGWLLAICVADGLADSWAKAGTPPVTSARISAVRWNAEQEIGMTARKTIVTTTIRLSREGAFELPATQNAA